MTHGLYLKTTVHLAQPQQQAVETGRLENTRMPLPTRTKPTLPIHKAQERKMTLPPLLPPLLVLVLVLERSRMQVLHSRRQQSQVQMQWVQAMQLTRLTPLPTLPNDAGSCRQSLI